MIEHKSKVSVIVPVFNGEKTLPPCLDSLLNQSYENYEIIAVDNDSADKTGEIIKDYSQKNSRIKYAFAGSGHASGIARNAGIKESSGEIIAFTDADCVCPTDWIEKITAPISSGKEKAVMGFEKDLINNYWTRNMQKRDNLYMLRSSQGNYIKTFDGKNAAIDAGLMRNLMFDNNIGMMADFDLSIRINMNDRILYLPGVKVGHSHRSCLKGIVNTYFTRGQWVLPIYKKYRNTPFGKGYTMFENMKLSNWLAFPFWITIQILKKPGSEAFFILITELSWRFGIIYSILCPKQK